MHLCFILKRGQKPTFSEIHHCLHSTEDDADRTTVEKHYIESLQSNTPSISLENGKVIVCTGRRATTTFLSGEITFTHLLYVEVKSIYLKKKKKRKFYDCPVPWNNLSNSLTWKEILSCENWDALFYEPLWTKASCDVYSCINVVEHDTAVVRVYK